MVNKVLIINNDNKYELFEEISYLSISNLEKIEYQLH